MEEDKLMNKHKRRYQSLLIVCIISILGCCSLGWMLIKSNISLVQSDFETILLSLLLNFTTVGVVFIVNYVFIVRENNDYEKYKESHMYEPIRNDLNKMLSGLQTLNAGLVGLEKVMYSNEDPPWDKLLSEAKSVDLCLFYVSESWKDKYGTVFKEFCEKGGNLNVYLPNPYEIKSRYVEKSIINRTTRNEIISTFYYFKRLSNKNNITVKMLEQGLNYVFARIEYTKKELYYFSPYSNSSSNGNLPKFLFNSELPKELESFFDKEKEFLKEKSEDFIDIEKEKYFIWCEDRKTVYLSTGLVCNNMCRFCYSSSLIENENQAKDPYYIAQIICKLLEIDSRLKTKPTVMLGGFNDPFHEDHFESTVLILNKLKGMGHPVHIATRFPLDSNQIAALPLFKELVINYSISTFPYSKNPTSELEPGNQAERFQTAEQLINKKANVALFIRPVIKDRTFDDLDRILDSTVGAGIKVITVGGLYFDNNIETLLSESNAPIDKKDVCQKRFVLDVDNHNKLMKNGENEVKRVVGRIKDFAKRKKVTLHVYENAKDRVKHFKNAVTPKTR